MWRAGGAIALAASRGEKVTNVEALAGFGVATVSEAMGRTHAAAEQCGEGDVLIVTTTSPSTDGMFGELPATALQRRGVKVLVTGQGGQVTRGVPRRPASSRCSSPPELPGRRRPLRRPADLGDLVRARRLTEGDGRPPGWPGSAAT